MTGTDIVFLIVEVLILLAILFETFLGWRWHKELMRKNKKNNDKEDAC